MKSKLVKEIEKPSPEARKFRSATITFTSNPKHYEVGDTIRIGLSDGTSALFVLKEIK